MGGLLLFYHRSLLLFYPHHMVLKWFSIGFHRDHHYKALYMNVIYV